MSGKKFSAKKRDTPLVQEIFQYQKHPETKKGSPTEIFGILSQKIFRR